MADIDRIELLIGLSNNMRADNEAWRRDVWKEGFERYKKVMQMKALFEQEYGNLEGEARRLEQMHQLRPNAELFRIKCRRWSSKDLRHELIQRKEGG